MAKIENFMLAADNPDGKPQRRPFFKKKRGGVLLTREQVAAIKLGRKLLRKELKARGIKSKEEFNLTASSMGLYFDKNRLWLLLPWLFHGRGLWLLLGSLLALLGTIFLYSTVTAMRGHFTINMSDGMFSEGFVLSETEDFANPTTHLFCVPAEDAPCISISHIPADIDNHEGQHNDTYFAYSFFLRNEGENTVGYKWSLDLNSESMNLAKACWVMVFEDGKMLFYAEPNDEGKSQALPAVGDNSRGYVGAPLIELNAQPEKQYELIAQRGNLMYYRVLPIPFITLSTVAEGRVEEVAPMEIHKYTVVIWLEGDDPDCTDELIGGHVGMEINMQLVSEESSAGDGVGSQQSRWDSFWDSLKFWKG